MNGLKLFLGAALFYCAGTASAAGKIPPMKKVLLIVADGMRPDSLEKCGNPLFGELRKHSIWTLEGSTVTPSLTLPCHMSLFHSVPPERHGISDNACVKPVPPLNGICEVLRKAGKKSAFFYNWEELRDVARPGSVSCSCCISSHDFGAEQAARRITAALIAFLGQDNPDFIFLHLDWPDSAGHEKYWMSPGYLHAVSGTLECIRSVLAVLPEEYVAVILADHGGHLGRHGTDMPEDMTIPIIFYHPGFAPKHLEKVFITDIAPTITGIVGADADPEWRGKSLFDVKSVMETVRSEF